MQVLYKHIHMLTHHIACQCFVRTRNVQSCIPVAINLRGSFSSSLNLLLVVLIKPNKALPITSQVFTVAVAMDDYCIAIYTNCTDKTTLGAITGVVTLPDAGSSAVHRHSLPLSPSPFITCVPEDDHYFIWALTFDLCTWATQLWESCCLSQAGSRISPHLVSFFHCGCIRCISFHCS